MNDHHARITRRLENGWPIRAMLAREFCPVGARALDIGAAYGEYTLPLAEIASHVDAVDIDQAPIDFMREAMIGHGISNVTTHCGDLCDFAASVCRYDFIMCMGTLMLIDRTKRAAYLRAMADMLADGGTILADFYGSGYVAYRLLAQSLTPVQRAKSLVWTLRNSGRTMSMSKFRSEVKRAGLAIAKEPPEIFYPGSPYEMCRAIEGHTFTSVFGRYFYPVLLTKQPA